MSSESRIRAARTNNTPRSRQLDSSLSLLIDERDSDGRTLLHVLARWAQKLGQLAATGRDINAQTTDGQTPPISRSAAHTTPRVVDQQTTTLCSTEGLTSYEGISHESGRGPERVGFSESRQTATARAHECEPMPQCLATKGREVASSTTSIDGAIAGAPRLYSTPLEF